MTERTVVTPLRNADCSVDEPFLRVVRGHLTAEELAALVVVLRESDRETAIRPATRRRSRWADPTQVLRRHPHGHYR
jgi:hypothetical protein